MNLIFMGTPNFAVPTLEALISNGHTVSMVVTKPDQPKGRGLKMAASPVKEKALELGLPLEQPESMRDPGLHKRIAQLKADLMVVVAFRILPASLFPLTRLGAVNIHGSLLPKYRGAAPIQWAVANGDTETGVTIFQLDAEIDHGTIINQVKTPIGPEETAGELFERLSVKGKEVLLETLKAWEAGQLKPWEQNHGFATPAPKLKKEDGRINWNDSARNVHNRIRAFNPYPICYTKESFSNRVLRIHKATVVVTNKLLPGEFQFTENKEPLIGTSDGALKLVEVQWDGKPRLNAIDFVNGLRGAESIKFN